MAISSQAEHFLNAFHVIDQHDRELQSLHEQRWRGQKGSGDSAAGQIGYQNDPQTGVVDFVLLAFSVELYVKATYEALGKKADNRHNIRTLFEKLPDHVQERIFKIHTRHRYGANLDEYKDWMDEISSGFEEFRYSYEHKTLTYHKGFALGMIAAMKQVISEVRLSTP